MNPQEIQKQNIESTKIPEKQEAKSESINIPKSSTLSKYPNFDVFTKTLNTLDSETKAKLLAILAGIPEDELTMYIEMDADNSNLITEDDIKRFITEKNTYTPKNVSFEGSNLTTTASESNKKSEEAEKAGVEKRKYQKGYLQEKLPQLKSIFQGNNAILSTLGSLENSYNEQDELDKKLVNKEISENEHIEKTGKIRENISQFINEYFSNKDNAKEFFQTLNEKNPELYKETYNAVIAISPELRNNFIAWGIPSEPYKEVEKISGGKIPPEIVAQLPGAKPEDIEKRGNLVSYNGKTIDLKTGRAFISGEGGYAIETSMKFPNSLDLRVKYQKERLEILDEIKTNEKILDLVKNKHKLKESLENLKKQKTENIGDNLPINIKINEIETEIKKIDEKLKQAVPGYNETQDEAFMRFLKYKIETAQEKLISIKTQFDKNMQELREAGQDEIKARDEKVRETIKFLDILGINNIHQNDLEKIFKQVNYNKNTYGLTKNIDLKEGFPDAVGEKHKYKLELIKLFSPMYEKMGIDINPHSLVAGIRSPNMPTDNIFKTKLEQIGVTRGGALNLNTTLQLLTPKQETQKKENTQETKKEAL